MRAAPILLSLVIAGAVTLPAAPISAKEHRSREVTREFQREHPLPLDRANKGRLSRLPERPIVLLACRGPDAVSNPQWQTIADAKAKDRWERKPCVR